MSYISPNMNPLRRFFLRLLISDVAPVMRPFNWTKEDAEGLETFLNTQTGVKLSLWMTNARAQKNAEVTHPQVSNREYQAGVANGWTELAKGFEMLARNQPEEDGKDLVLGQDEISDNDIEEALKVMATGGAPDIDLG